MGTISIEVRQNDDFINSFNKLKEEYGEDFQILNGLHKSQLDFSTFIDGFVDNNTVADATIDGNANAHHKDICSLCGEKGKAEDKLFAFNKIFYEMKKKYGLRTAKQWLEDEWTGAFYMHDAASTTYKPYCFTGDTKILTNIGIHPLSALVGKPIKVLNKYHGWEDATIKYFGKAPIRILTLERYGNIETIRVTGNHKWFVKNKKGTTILSTDELKEGMRIPFNTSKVWSQVLPSPFGVAHGFMTGDGQKGVYARANFCGDKTALIPYFTPANISGNEKELQVSYGIPKYFTGLPSLNESVSYLYGWLSGYFAADGCVDERGRCTISSVKYENLEFVRQVLCVLGMPVNSIRYQDRISNLTNEMGRVYILSLSDEYLKEDFFIRPSHKERFLANANKERKDRSWKVISVADAKYEDDVYCAVVPGSESFTLDCNILTHNCFAYDLTRLAKEGLFFLDDYNNEPPKHLTTFFDDVIEYVSFFSNRSSGAVGLPNVLLWAMYFWNKDVESGYYIKDPDYYLKQCYQKFIYRLNQPFLRIDQSAFVNVSIFDNYYYESLFGGVEFPDGSFAIDFVDEFLEHEKIFMQEISDIRKHNMFTFPVLTYSLLKRDDLTKEEMFEMIRTKDYHIFKNNEFARWCSDNNCTWNDSNFFMSKDVTTLSNCCRLLSDASKLSGFINSIGGTALSIGSVKVSTINLMRIALESEGDEKKYLNILKKRTLLDCKVLDVVRHIISRNVEKGLLPNYCEGGIEMDKQYCTIGILGLYEAIEYFGYLAKDEFGNVSYTDKGIEFADKIFKVLNEVKDNFTQDYSFNIESVPAERAAVILCQKDNLLYERDGSKFIYSNQWIPLMEKCTIDEKLRLSSILDAKCSGGAIAHINIENNFPNKDVAWDMLNKIAISDVIYFAFNSIINECENHHGFVGTDICPICGKPVFDTYTRIVGFLEPRRTYSSVRKRERDARQWYKYANNKLEI